jgi:hypothetical protein
MTIDLSFWWSMLVIGEGSTAEQLGHWRAIKPGELRLVTLLFAYARVDRSRDCLVSAQRRRLVDNRGTLAVVPHPRHQVTKPSATPGRQVVARVRRTAPGDHTTHG